MAFDRYCSVCFVDCAVLAQFPKRKPAAKRYVRIFAQPDLFVLDFVYSAIALDFTEQLAVFAFGGCNVHRHPDTC